MATDKSRVAIHKHSFLEREKKRLRGPEREVKSVLEHNFHKMSL